MKAIILILGAICCKTFAAETCGMPDPSTKPVAMPSTAPFWKGVDGAQFIEELTDDNHDEFIKNNPTAFIMYYLPCESLSFSYS